MNTAAQTFVIALASVAAAAAIGITLGNHGTAPAGEVVQLERVVVVGQRAQAPVQVVARLPRVVIESRRAVDVAAADAQVAQPTL
jgi:hypothetical protein